MKRISFFIISLLLSVSIFAAERFVTFQPSADAISISKAGISFDNREHSCVQLAIASLKQDFERVTGKAADAGEGILIGTGCSNKQIDQGGKKFRRRYRSGRTCE